MEISNEPFVATVPLPQAQESVPVPAKKSNKLLITLLIALPILVVLLLSYLQHSDISNCEY